MRAVQRQQHRIAAIFTMAVMKHLHYISEWRIENYENRDKKTYIYVSGEHIYISLR